jgi:4a-hydroxytetrahydrobiopterin dehydratase
MSDWSRTDRALARTLEFASFPDAVAFVTRLGFYAESVDHHPDILIQYKKVTVTWSTHDIGGVTAKDEAGAKATDQLAGTVPG